MFKRSIFAIFLSLISAFGSVQIAHSQNTPEGSSSSPTEDMIKAILIKEGVNIMLRNIEASKNEKGDMAKLLRAISGISATDIEKYGICGGPNSEVRKLFGSLC